MFSIPGREELRNKGQNLRVKHWLLWSNPIEHGRKFLWVGKSDADMVLHLFQVVRIGCLSKKAQKIFKLPALPAPEMRPGTTFFRNCSDWY